jgi:hypothetical protein
MVDTPARHLARNMLSSSSEAVFGHLGPRSRA